jgi:hypothetical protein
MEITGRVVQILPIEQGVSKTTGNQWQKATVIVEYKEGMFSHNIALFSMKKASELMQVRVGVEYTFNVTPESRESNGRWFTSISTWSWKEADIPTPQYSAPQPVYQAPAQPQYADAQQPYMQPQAQYTQQQPQNMQPQHQNVAQSRFVSQQPSDELPF